MKLEDAYAIIDGIPARRFKLSTILANNEDYKDANDPFDCGTIGCAIGWLALHPQANAEGLSADKNGNLEWRHSDVDFDVAAAKLFNLPQGDMFRLFMQARFSEGRGSDKEIWKRRVRNYLRYGDV